MASSDNSVAQAMDRYGYTLADLFRASDAHQRPGAEPCESEVQKMLTAYGGGSPIPPTVLNFLSKLKDESKKVDLNEERRKRLRRKYGDISRFTGGFSMHGVV